MGERQNGEKMKKQFKKLLVMLMVMTLMLSFVGCGTKEETTNDNSTTVTPGVENTTTGEDASKENENATTPEAQTEVTYPVTITDSYGIEITLEKEPEKVISIAPNMTELVFALGKEQKLIGRTEYCDYPEAATKIESIGSMMKPDIEKVISLEPDVVFVSTHFDEENRKKLADLGIKVVGLYEEHEMTGVYTMIETLGTTLNAKETASTVVADMKAKVDDVTAKVANEKKPSVYYVVGFGEGGDYTASGNTFIGKMIEMAGGENIAKDVEGWSYSKESLVEADPEYIIIASGLKEQFMETEGYKDLTAVKEGRVYGIDENLLNRQGNRNADALIELAKIIHPEVFK